MVPTSLGRRGARPTPSPRPTSARPHPAQIEHHLWPRMPRHHLPAVTERTKALCKKHGLPYTVAGLWECSVWLTGYLGRVAKAKQV